MLPPRGVHTTGALLLPKLRSNIAEFLNEGFLKRLRILSSPTCVGLRYGHLSGSLRGFSWQHGVNQFTSRRTPRNLLRLNGAPDLPKAPLYRLELRIPSRRWPTLLRHPITQMSLRWYRNVNLFPITYAFRPRLRGRLTLSGLTFLRNPWVFGEGVSRPFYRYSCRHTHFYFVHRSSRSGFSLL